ncbi:MAG TPA: HAMP domain-containing protein, partial [Deltaproteobacteria bacterium]|nr:HAMP domain-containing protein [Deltaproteobacteria bacterium]
MIRLSPRTVTFRIAFLYVILSSAVAGVVFTLVYLTLATDLMQRTEEELLKMVKELHYIHKATGRDGTIAELKILEKTEGANRMFARVLNADNKVIATTEMSAWGGVDRGVDQLQDLEPKLPRFRTMSMPNRHHKLRCVNLKTADGTVYQVGYSLRDDDEILEDFRQVFSQAFVFMLVCGGIVGWFLSKRAMSGVERVREAALSIGTGDFSRRVPLGNEGQEIVDLATAFNEMIEKIRLLIEDLKNVTDDIAHDLRSPITRMRGAAETTLIGEQNLSDYQDLAGTVVEECDRLVSMINTMLEIAETDAVAIQTSEVDMCSVLREAHELFEAVADEKSLTLEIVCPQTPLPVSGDRARLQ